MKKPEPVQIVAAPSQPDEVHPVLARVVGGEFKSGEACLLYATEHADDDDDMQDFLEDGGSHPYHSRVHFRRGPRFVQGEIARYVKMSKGHGKVQRFVPGAMTTGLRVPTWYGLAIKDFDSDSTENAWKLYLYSTEGDRDTAFVMVSGEGWDCIVIGVSDGTKSDNVVFYGDTNGAIDSTTRRFFTHLSVEGLEFEREGLYERPWATGKVQLHHTGPYRLVVPESRSEYWDGLAKLGRETDQMAARIIDGRGGERPAEPDGDHATTEVDQERLVPFINVPPSKMATGRNFISVGPDHKSASWASEWTVTCQRIGAPLMTDKPRNDVIVWSSRWTCEQVRSWPFWEMWQTMMSDYIEVITSDVAIAYTHELAKGATVRFMRPLVLVGQGPDGVIEYEQRNQCHFDRFPDPDQWEFKSSTEGAAGTRPWRAVCWLATLNNRAPDERWRLRVWSSLDQDDQPTTDDDSTRVEPVVEEAFVLPTEPGWYWAETTPKGSNLVRVVVLRDEYWAENGNDTLWTQEEYAERARQFCLTFERIPESMTQGD